MEPITIVMQQDLTDFLCHGGNARLQTKNGGATRSNPKNELTPIGRALGRECHLKGRPTIYLRFVRSA